MRHQRASLRDQLDGLMTGLSDWNRKSHDNLGNLSTQRSLRSPCTGALRDESLRVPCNWASKSAIGQIYLISEGLTREAGHHFRCMKHFPNLWNTYGDALLSWTNFINSYMLRKAERVRSALIKETLWPNRSSTLMSQCDIRGPHYETSWMAWWQD